MPSPPMNIGSLARLGVVGVSGLTRGGCKEHVIGAARRPRQAEAIGTQPLSKRARNTKNA